MPLPGARREDVEHVLAFARLVGRAGVARASCPRAVGGERIARHAAQEVDALLLRALLVLDAVDQVLQALRVARLADASSGCGRRRRPACRRRSPARISRSARRRSCSFARCTTSSFSGSATEARIATIATVITSSMSVKPFTFIRRGFTPPNGTWSAPRRRLGGAAGGAGAGCGAARRRRRQRDRRQRHARRAARDLGAGGELGRARASGRASVRTRRGVMSSTISVLRGRVARAGEQAPDHRQVAQPGHAVCALAGPRR